MTDATTPPDGPGVHDPPLVPDDAARPRPWSEPIDLAIAGLWVER